MIQKEPVVRQNERIETVVRPGREIIKDTVV